MATISFSSIREALSQPVSRHFWAEKANGELRTGNPLSYYHNKLLDDEKLVLKNGPQPQEPNVYTLSFDISNNKTLANLDLNGTLKNITFYRSSFRVDSTSGVCVHKDFSAAGPFQYKLLLNGVTHSLPETGWDFKTSLLDNIFPITTYKTGDLVIRLVIYTPVSQDGQQRPRGVLYGIQVENIGDQVVEGSIVTPTFNNLYQDWKGNKEGRDTCEVDICLADGLGRKAQVDFCLAPGGDTWVATLFSPPGDNVIAEIDALSSLRWLNSTWSYYRGVLGRLSMPADEFTAEFFERALCVCLQTMGMEANGKLAGSNNGSYPTTPQVWLSDMFYTFVPMCQLEPDLCRRNILWSAEYSVRRPGKNTRGGVTHSLSTALNAVVMAGLYYANTGDAGFFREHPELEANFGALLTEVIASRTREDVWLFPSLFISDGLSFGDYHTGTNIVAWYAFQSFARILEEVYGKSLAAENYRGIASKIKRDLEARNIIVGPLGRQYVEGSGDGLNEFTALYTANTLEEYRRKYGSFQIAFFEYFNLPDKRDYLFHDGEESDTTLAPFFGFTAFDDEVYRNYTRFAVSPHNRFYRPLTRSIIWDDMTDASFPGFITGLASAVDRDTMSGSEGYMTVIRRLTDVDGSIWWWPYPFNTTDATQVSRTLGKCGWAAGVFAGLFINDFLGARYDAPTRKLRLRPFNPNSDYTWDNARFGNSVFKIGSTRTEDSLRVTVTNLNAYPVELELELVGAAGQTIAGVREGQQALNPRELSTAQFMGRPSVRVSDQLLSGEAKVYELV